MARLSLWAGALFGLADIARASTLVVYPPPPVPQIYAWHNDDFTVRVREVGGTWRDLYEYRIRVDWDRPQDASMVYFDFDGSVEIEVQKNNGRFDHVAVSPRSSPISVEKRASVVRMTLDRPERFSLQFDDDRLHNLHILAGGMLGKAPSGTNVRRFGPGVHTPPDGASTFPLRSGETVFLDGGAILTGGFSIDGLHDVRISGRGLFYNPGRAIDINQGRNVSLSDFILVNDEKAPAARVVNIRNSANVDLQDISGFTAGKWSDGINISTSQHVDVDRAYLRTSDDAVVVYAVTDCPICTDAPIAPVGPVGAPDRLDTFDIHVTNSIFWNDVAHSMYVGHFGDNVRPRTIRDIVFDNIDVANLDEDDPAWEGAMAIFAGDSTTIRNIAFRNIRVDRIEEGKLIHIRAGYNPRYNKAPGAGVDNILLDTIAYSGDGMPSASLIAGEVPAARVRGVSIHNLTIAGRAITGPEEGDIRIGPMVEWLEIH